MKTRLLFCFIIFVLGFGVKNASAVNFAWKTGATGAWSNGANWTGGSGSNWPGSTSGQTDNVTLGFSASITYNGTGIVGTIGTIGISNTVTLTLSANLTATGGITFGSNTISIAGTGFILQGASLTSSATLAITGGLKITNTAGISAGSLVLTGGSFEVDGVLTCSQSITTTGTSTLTLSNATGTSTMSGGLTVSSGTLTLAGTGTSTTSNLTVSGSSAGFAMSGSCTLTPSIFTFGGQSNQTTTIGAGCTFNMSSANITIGTGGCSITNNGTFSLSQCNLIITNNPFTFTNNKTLKLLQSNFTMNTGSCTFKNNSPGIATVTGNVTMSAASETFSNSGEFDITNTATGTGFSFGSGTFTNTGTYVAVTAPLTCNGSSGSVVKNTAPGYLTLSTGSNFSISGNSSTFANTGKFGVISSNITINIGSGSSNFTTNGTFYAKNAPITISAGNIINNSGVFNQILSNFIPLSGNGAGIINGTPGVYHVTGSAMEIPSLGSITNTGTSSSFTVDSTSTILLDSKAFISNSSPATFNIGTSGSSCVLTTTTSEGGALQVIANTGTFNVGSTSSLTINNTASQQATINNTSGVFTLMSDAFGSASIGPLFSAAAAGINGNFNVERYFAAQSGVSTTAGINRNYRLLSTPVNVGGLSYLQSNSGGITGVFTAGAGSGFTATNPNGNSTIYLYEENFLPTNTSFNSGNFKGITSISSSSTVSVPITQAGNGTPVAETLHPGNGYMLYYVGNNTANLTNKLSKVALGGYAPVDASTFTAIGAINTGTIAVSLWNSSSTSLTYTAAGGTGYQLVGNPYPSTIDWDQYTGQAGFTYTDISSTIAVFDYSSKNYGVYTASTPLSATHNASRYIASGQGFFIQVTAAGSPNSGRFSFLEACKTTTQPTTPLDFFSIPPKPSKKINDVGATALVPNSSLPTQNTSSQQALKIILAKDSVNTDETVLFFDPNSANKYEPDHDVLRLNGIGNVSTLGSYSSDGTGLLVLNWIHSIDSTTRVKLYVSVSNSTGVDTLSGKYFSTLDPRYDVYLIDHYKNDSLLFSKYPKYQFNIINTDTASYGANRFEIAFHKNSLLAAYRLTSFTATPATGGVLLTWTTANEQNLTGFNLQRQDGSVFISLDSLQSDGSGKYTYLDKTPLNGTNYYRLLQNDVFGEITYSKTIAVTIGEPGTVSDPISIYPNPAAAVLNVRINTNVPDIIKLKIYNMSGVVLVANEMSGNSNVQQNVSGLKTGDYIIQILDKANNIIGAKKFIKQ